MVLKKKKDFPRWEPPAGAAKGSTRAVEGGRWWWERRSTGPALSCPPRGHRQEGADRCICRGPTPCPSPPCLTGGHCHSPRRRHMEAHSQPAGGDHREGMRLWTKTPHFRNTPTVRNITRSAREREWKRGRKPVPSISLFTKIFTGKNGVLIRVLQGRNQTKELRFVRVNDCLQS